MILQRTQNMSSSLCHLQHWTHAVHVQNESVNGWMISSFLNLLQWMIHKISGVCHFIHLFIQPVDQIYGALEEGKMQPPEKPTHLVFSGAWSVIATFSFPKFCPHLTYLQPCPHHRSINDLLQQQVMLQHCLSMTHIHKNVNILIYQLYKYTRKPMNEKKRTSGRWVVCSPKAILYSYWSTITGYFSSTKMISWNEKMIRATLHHLLPDAEDTNLDTWVGPLKLRWENCFGGRRKKEEHN